MQVESPCSETLHSSQIAQRSHDSTETVSVIINSNQFIWWCLWWFYYTPSARQFAI